MNIEPVVAAPPGPPPPDPEWDRVARLVEVRRSSGFAPGEDARALAEVRGALSAIDARSAGPSGDFEIITTDDIAEPLPPRFYPIRSFALAPGPPTLFLSFSFGGKSVILQDLMLSIATGTRVWGQFGADAGRVLHVDYEQGRDETIDRYQRLARGRGIDIRRDARPRLEATILPKMFINSPGAEEAYKRVCDGRVMCFVDTFAASVPGVEENESAVGEHLYMLGRVSEATGCVMLVAHHMGKASLSKDAPKDPRALARGSTAIVAAAGYVYALGGGKGEPKLVQQAKARGLGDPMVEDFYLDLSAVDCRGASRPLRAAELSDRTDPEREEQIPAYRNPANPADLGGFTVTYRTVEQVQLAEAAEGVDEDSRLRDRVLEYVRRENARGQGVRGKEVIAKACKARLAAVRTLVESMLQSGAIIDRPVKESGRSRSRYWIAS